MANMATPDAHVNVHGRLGEVIESQKLHARPAYMSRATDGSWISVIRNNKNNNNHNKIGIAPNLLQISLFAASKKKNNNNNTQK